VVRYLDTGKKELVKKLQQELDRRTALELNAIHLITEHDYKGANEILASIDNRIIEDIYRKLE